MEKMLNAVGKAIVATLVIVLLLGLLAVAFEAFKGLALIPLGVFAAITYYAYKYDSDKDL